MSRIDPAKFDGALLGLAVGDALGWPVEPRGRRAGGTKGIVPRPQFEPWQRDIGGPYQRHKDPIPAGVYSDDTQLSIAVARSLLRENWLEHLMRLELPLWPSYEMGGGGAVLGAARSWERGKPPWTDPKLATRYRNAGANGVAMRVLPHALCSLDEGFDPIRREVVQNGILTHAHPRALVGAQLYAFACSVAVNLLDPLNFGQLVDACLVETNVWSRFDPDDFPTELREFLGNAYIEEWHSVVGETINLLSACERGLSHGAISIDNEILTEFGAFGPENGSGTVTAVSAIYLASRHASQPLGGLMAASYAFGSDADTLGSMTGGLLGCIHGSEWLGPLAHTVQDSEYLRDLARELRNGRGRIRNEGPLWSFNDRRKFSAAVGERDVENLQLPVFGRLRPLTLENLHTSSSNVITTVWFESEIGQTIRFKRISRLPRGGQAPPKREAIPEPPPIPEPRIGFVLHVQDLEASAHFYAEVLGARPTLTNGSRISFGAVALVRDDRVGQRTLVDPGHLAGEVTLHTDINALAITRDRLRSANVSFETLESTDSKEVILCLDPDHNTVRIVATPPRA